MPHLPTILLPLVIDGDEVGCDVRLRTLLSALALLLLCGGLPGLTPTAAAEPRDVTVVTHDLTPFVMRHAENLSGFTVDIWDEIAKRQDWNTNYLDVPSVSGQLQAVATDQADVAAGAISITADRERKFDFSQPILNAGLQIIVPARSNAPSAPGLKNFLDLLFSKSMLVWLFAGAVISIVPAHILWFIERRHTDSMVSSSYFPGIFQAFGWGLSALAAANDDAPRHWFTRCMAILWAFVSIIFVAFYTATLTATLTVQKFDSQISGPADLFGKQVATVAGTTSAAYLQNMGVHVTTTNTIEDSFALLRDKQYDAVVFDAPVLQYYVSHDGDGVAQIAGPRFQAADYGFAFRIGSNLRKPVDETLLSMREDGTYDEIKQKWFGSDEAGAASPG